MEVCNRLDLTYKLRYDLIRAISWNIETSPFNDYGTYVKFGLNLIQTRIADRDLPKGLNIHGLYIALCKDPNLYGYVNHNLSFYETKINSIKELEEQIKVNLEHAYDVYRNKRF